jgi:hypothetical protein
MNISGPIESVIIAGRRFECDAEAECTIILSGLKNEVKFAGSGKKRIVRSFTNGSFKGVEVVINHENKDLEYMRNLQSKSDFFDVTITFCDGTVYAGSVQFVDDIEESTKEGTAGISLEGDFEQQ